MTISTNYADLLKRQAELQRLGGMPEPSREQLYAALLDEIGELNHELKPLWAWWKKAGDGNEVNRERVLEEAADVLHFALMLTLSQPSYTGGAIEKWESPAPPYGVVQHMLSQFNNPTRCPDGYSIACLLCTTVAHFGYTPDDLVHAYLLKTDENLRRWKEAADAAE